MVVALAQHLQAQSLNMTGVRSILDVHSLCSSAPDDKSCIVSSPILSQRIIIRKSWANKEVPKNECESVHVT
jgi:hypothetical protein